MGMPAAIANERTNERSQADIELLAAREAQLRSAAPAAAAPDAMSDPNTVLCRSCWQAAIKLERKTGVSRLRGYRRRHPTGAQEQCGGPTWW